MIFLTLLLLALLLGASVGSWRRSSTLDAIVGALVARGLAFLMIALWQRRSVPGAPVTFVSRSEGHIVAMRSSAALITAQPYPSTGALRLLIVVAVVVGVIWASKFWLSGRKEE